MTTAATLVLLALGVMWVSGSLLVAHVAIQRGRDGTAWGFGALILFTPLLALLALIALPAKKPTV